MSTMFDNEKFGFQCPKCKKKLSETIGRLKRGAYSCPGCGQKFDTSEIRRELDKAQRSVDDFTRKLGSMKINIKL
jgi:ribosomal protein L37AE/L43A